MAKDKSKAKKKKSVETKSPAEYTVANFGNYSKDGKLWYYVLFTGLKEKVLRKDKPAKLVKVSAFLASSEPLDDVYDIGETLSESEVPKGLQFKLG